VSILNKNIIKYFVIIDIEESPGPACKNELSIYYICHISLITC